MNIRDYLDEKRKQQERKIRWEIAKKKTEDGRNVALGAILGTAAGVIAGLLLAPKSGEETRKDIKNAAEDASRTVKSNVNDTIDTIKYKTDEIGYDLKDKYSDFQDRGMTRIKKLQEGDDYDEEDRDSSKKPDSHVREKLNVELTEKPHGEPPLSEASSRDTVDTAFETTGDSAACLDDVESKARENMEKMKKASGKSDSPVREKLDVELTEKPHGEPPLSEASSRDTVDTAFETTGDSAACLDDVESKARENIEKMKKASGKSDSPVREKLDVELTEKPHGEPPLSEASSRDTVDTAFETTGDSAACLDDVESKAKENIEKMKEASNKNKNNK